MIPTNKSEPKHLKIEEKDMNIQRATIQESTEP
jgi:hypothetical protein